MGVRGVLLSVVFSLLALLFGFIAMITPGPVGLQGEQGISGVQGVPGGQGLQGEKGPQGLQGPAGVPGPQGQQGPQGPGGPRGLVQVVEVPAGPQYPSSFFVDDDTNFIKLKSVRSEGSRLYVVFNFVPGASGPFTMGVTSWGVSLLCVTFGEGKVINAGPSPDVTVVYEAYENGSEVVIYFRKV